MASTPSRDQLWKEYYRAMHNGDKQRAQQILSALHNPPAGAGQNQARPAGRGCSRCRRSF